MLVALLKGGHLKERSAGWRPSTGCAVPHARACLGARQRGTGLCAADDLSFEVVPVEQQPYDPAWPTRYEAARSELAPIFGADAMIEHIGSTSIPGCSAQPIIDILVQLPGPLNFDQRDGLEALNYGNQLGDDAAEVFFRPEPATKVHVTSAGSKYAAHRVAFRDYLRGHEKHRQQYEQLKADQAAAHPEDPMAYTAGKIAFVMETIDLAELAEPQKLD